MPGIIITPGTFNPPATPVVSHGAYAWPKTKVQTVRRVTLQFTSRRAEEPVDTGTTLEVDFVSIEYTTGEITVGVITDSFDSSPTEITTAGVRYLADGPYTKTGFNGPNKEYDLEADPILVADTTGIDFGSVEVKDSNDYGSQVNVTFGYNITLSGTGDSAVYTLAVGSSEATLTATSGTIQVWVSGSSVDQYAIIPFSLFRDGVLFDRIVMAIRITGSITSSSGGPDTRPEVSSGITIADTLHGAEASPGEVAAPVGVPLGGYFRQSSNVQGTASYP